MILVLCDRCGRLAPRGTVVGHCALCSPSPDALHARQRAVDARHREAVRDAVDGIVVPKRAPSTRPPRGTRLPGIWRLVTERRDTPAHLFAPGTDVTRSLCGTVTLRGPADPAPPGMRGCRRCALAAGWIESLSESVTT